MDLLLATSIFSAILTALGAAFFMPQFKPFAFGFLRSRAAALVLFGSGAIWFLYILYHLGEADFGQYKFYLMAIFGAAGVSAFKYLPDFLSVRGLCVLALLFMRVCVDSAFMQEPESRKIMVAIAYAVVVAAIYFGCLPYRMRDLFEWLYARECRVKAFAAILMAAGLSMCVATLFY